MPSLESIAAKTALIDEINSLSEFTTKIKISDDVLTISDYRIVISYNQHIFQWNADLYISLQLQSHQTFRRELLKEIDKQKAEIGELLDLQGDREFWTGLLPENIYRTGMRILTAPVYALSGTTWERESKQLIEQEVNRIKSYDLLKACLQYGAHFFNHLVPQKSIGTLEIQVGACAAKAEEVAGLYSKLSCLGEQKVKLLRQEQRFFFPHSSAL